MRGESVRLREIERRFLDMVPRLSLRQQQVALTLTRLLTEGEPVGLERLSKAVAMSPESAEAALAGLRSVVRDEHGGVVSCCGLSLRETPHRLDIDEHRLYTWCAWDALMLPELLGRAVRVTSRCPVTGELVSIEVGPDGPRTARPGSAVLSFVLPDLSPEVNAFHSFCRFVSFFSSRESGMEWASGNEYVFLLSLDEGYRLGQAVNRACFPAVLPSYG